MSGVAADEQERFPAARLAAAKTSEPARGAISWLLRHAPNGLERTFSGQAGCHASYQPRFQLYPIDRLLLLSVPGKIFLPTVLPALRRDQVSPRYVLLLLGAIEGWLEERLASVINDISQSVTALLDEAKRFTH